MTELEKFKLVNACETLEELAQAIEAISDENGMIQGRTKYFNAERMASHCMNFRLRPANTLTREYGIRQQGLYILYYDK